MTCSNNIIKKDGTTGGLFPLVSSMFSSPLDMTMYNAVMSKEDQIARRAKSAGVNFTNDGVNYTPNLDYTEMSELIKSIDPKAKFTYDTSAPSYIDTENRYNISKLELDTILPKSDKSLMDLYNEKKEYSNKKLTGDSNTLNRVSVTPKTLKALMNSSVIPTKEGPITVVYKGDLSKENIQWVEVNEVVDAVAEVHMKFKVPVRYNKTPSKALKPASAKLKMANRLYVGSMINVNSTIKNKLVRDYVKAMEQYMDEDYSSVKNDIQKTDNVNAEEMSIGDFLQELKRIDSKVLTNNTDVKDHKYKKFLVNQIEVVTPLLDKSRVSSSTVEYLMNELTMSGVSIVKQDQIMRNGKYIGGYYDYDTKTIYLDQNLPSNILSQVLLHEAVHALSLDKIPGTYKESLHSKYSELTELNMVYAHIKRNYPQFKFIQDLQEFAAQVFTNKELQDVLNSINTTDIGVDYAPRNVFTVMFDSIYKFFKRLFDPKDINNETINTVLHNIQHIIKHQEEIANAKDSTIYEFELNSGVTNSIDSIFDAIFDGNDQVKPSTLKNIEDFTATYNGPNLTTNNTTNYLEVDPRLGHVKIYDTVEGEKFFTFTKEDQRSLNDALSEAKEELITQLTSRRDDLADRLAVALNAVPGSENFDKALNSVGNAFRSNGKELRRNIVENAGGSVKTGFMSITEFMGDNYDMELESLKDKNIVIQVEETKDGKNSYSIVLTSVQNPAGKTRNSFMSNYLDSSNKTWTNTEAARLGFTVEQNVKGRKQLTAALLMMQIKKKDPNAVFDQVKYFSIANTNSVGNGSLQELNMSEALDNWKNLKKTEVLNNLPDEIQELLEEKTLFESSQYKQSYIPVALNYYRHLKEDKKIETDLAGIDYDLTDITRDRKKLIDAVHARIDYLKNVYGHKKVNQESKLLDTTSWVGQEMNLLSQTLYELQSNKLGVDTRDLNKGMRHDAYEQYTKTRKDYFSPILNFANNNINKILSKFKGKYQVYAKRKIKFTTRFLDTWKKENGASIRNGVFNYTENFYENLYETIEAKVLDSHNKETGEVKTVNTMKLKDLKDPSLSANEITYLEDVLSSIRKEARELIRTQLKNGNLSVSTGKTEAEKIRAWEVENMKIKLDHNDNILDWGGYRLVPGMKKGLLDSIIKGNAAKGFANEMDLLHDEFLDTYDEGALDKKTGLGVLSSFTMNGSENTKYGRNTRLEKIGLVSIDNEIFVKSARVNDSVSRDLQLNSDFYVGKLIKHQHYHELQKEYQIGKVLLIQQRIEEGLDNSKEMKMFVDHAKALVNNETKKLMLGNGKTDYAKIVGATTSMVSRTVLGGSLGSFFTAWTGAIMTTLVASTVKSYGKRFLNIASYKEAAKFVFDPTNQDMLHDIMEINQIHNSDEGKKFFNDNIKAGSNTFMGKMKGVVTGRNWLQLLSTGDYYVKGLMLIGQMVYDDVLKHYKYDTEGDLYYDAEAERREPSKNKYRREEFEQTMLELEEEGSYKNEDGNFLTPYSYRMINSLKTINAQLLGAFTDEERTLASLSPILSGAMQMKTFLIAKANMVYAREYTNENISWLEQDDNGELAVKFHTGQGLLNTMGDMVSLILSADRLDAKAWSELMSNPTKRSNLMFAGVSLALFAIAYLAYAQVDDEWKKKNPYSIYVKASIADIVGYMNPVEYINALTTPVSIIYMKRLANNVSKMVQLDFDEAREQAMRLSGVTRTFQNFKKISEYDPIRISM